MQVPVCVVGGAGYVGSQTVWALHNQGWDVVVYDNLSTGHASLLPPDIPLIHGDIRDVERFEHTLTAHNIQAIIHCAALSIIPDSIAAPEMYWSINVHAAGAMLQVAKRTNIRAFVFSSSASVYGLPQTLPICESHPIQPTHPYGETKAAFETLLTEAHNDGGPPWLSFRYFNAAGADLQGRCGEHHTPETHLIPNVLRTALSISRSQPPNQPLTLFGNDYPTPDGTPIRDYIHTVDIAQAHIRGLHYLLSGRTPTAVNLGSGTGISLLDMIQAAASITGVHIPYSIGPRRHGDPPQLIASNARAFELLRWTPKHSTPHTILQTAWDWIQKIA